MSASPAHPARLGALVLLLTLATCVALAVGGGNPAVALAPVLAAGVAWALWKAPLRLPMLLILLVGLTANAPSERPGNGRWSSPLLPLGQLLFENLNNSTGIRALRFSGLDALIAVLLALVVYRKAMRRDVDGARTTETASCLLPFLALSLFGVLLMEAWGLLRHGDFKQSLWQMRPLLHLPLLGFLFHASLRGPADHKLLGAMLLGSALLKVAFGLYVYVVIYRPLNIKPHYATTHADSMLYTAAVVMILARWNERRDAKGWLLMGLLPLLGVGMIVNNRRLVWVEVALALVVLYGIVPWNAVKRAVTRAALVALPLVPLYLAAGWSSNAKVFKPAQTFRSLVSPQSDASTATREIENFNLYWTFKTNPLLGTGWGHEYIEFVQAYDISEFFAQYLYVPHNSVLALWAFGGLVGFTLIWMPLLVGIYLAVRSYHFARRVEDRTAALTVVAVIVAFIVQAYGDMGLQSGMGVFLVATALAVAAKLAVAVGAWPSLRAARAPALPTPVAPALPRPATESLA